MAPSILQVINTGNIAHRLAKAQRLARLLDSEYKIGNFRFGWDGILGLLPGFGDTITFFCSLYIVAQGVLAGCSLSTLILMLFNLGVEYAIGPIPLVGDLFDFVWKANLKNVRLIERHVENPKALQSNSRIRVIALFSLVAFIGASFIYGLYLAFGYLFQVILAL